jgi:hypothetical protein
MGASGWFRKALSGRWVENDGSVKIQGHDIQTFQLFLNYANKGRLFDSMRHMVITFIPHFDRAEWPIKLVGEEGKANNMAEAPKESIPMVRTRSQTKAIEEASRKRKRSNATGDTTTKDTPRLDNNTTKPAKDLTSLSVNDILALYHLADFRDVPGLADLAVSVMLEKIATTSELPILAVEYLLEHIPDRANGEHCHMFAMLVNIAARYVSGVDFTLHMADIPPEFLIAVLNRQRGLANEERMRTTTVGRGAYADFSNPTYYDFGSSGGIAGTALIIRSVRSEYRHRRWRPRAVDPDYLRYVERELAKARKERREQLVHHW